MATHIPESRKAVRKYLNEQWTTMSDTLGDLESNDGTKAKEAKNNFEAFEMALSFPYNQKLAYFPADKSINEDNVTPGRGRGEFGEGSLVPSFEEPSYKEIVNHQSAMLASLYARQEFIRAAARMPMTLFVGPSRADTAVRYPPEGTLLTSEKFSRVVFSGSSLLKSAMIEYVAVAELSRTYPQNAIVRVWWTGEPGNNETRIIDDVVKRWNEIVGQDEKTAQRILFQRGEFAKKGIPLLTRGLLNETTKDTYMQHVDERAEMWANVIALTASDKHGDTNLLEGDNGKKLWLSEADDDDVSMEGWQWMAAMLALRRIPYIVKNAKDVNKDPFPHALTQAEAETVEIMMSQITEGRTAATEGESSSSSVNGKIGSRQQRVISSETEQWW